LHYEKFADGTIKCIENELPFEIPESWAWVRLGTISTYAETKRKINIQEAPSDVWSLDLEDIEKGGRLLEYKTAKDRKTVGDRNIFKAGNILYSKLRPYLLKILIAQKDGICSSEIVPFSLYGGIISEYVITVLKCPYIDNFINSATYGVKMPRVSTETMSSLFIPIPSIKEQQRIVRKLNEATPIISEYDSVYSRVEELDIKFPQQLKKSILQWAVQGKLIQQDENDEPASMLLERIRAEKEELFKQGKLKKEKHKSVIFRRDNSYYERLDGVERCIDDEIPFEIPKSWEWVRLMEICTYIQRGKSPEYSPIKKYPVIAQKCIQWSGFSIESAKFIKPNSIQTYAKERLLEDNDLMWNSTGLGSLGRIGIYKSNLNPFELAVTDSHVTVIRPFKRANLSKYLYYYFSNPSVQNVIEDSADGSTKQKELATTTIKTYLVPIPNLLEQHRIVNKVEDLLKLIKTL